MYPKLVIFAGYSNSGKSTQVIPILRSLGYKILSSSVLLHEFSEDLVEKVFKQPKFDSYDRDLIIEIATKITASSGMELNNSIEATSRQFLIDLAEKALVSTFTRAVFVNALADKVISNLDNESKFAVECFNTAELKFFCERLVSANAYDPVCFNLRRDEERPHVDGRNLIPLAKEIWNDGSYENLKEKIIAQLVKGEKKQATGQIDPDPKIVRSL